MINHVKDYPRPQLVRENFTLLNGEWDFAFDRPQFEGTKINVPFTYETKMSGIGRTEAHNEIWYRREFVARRQPHERMLLHFEGSDYITNVYVNGQFAGSHKGGYARFSFDITDLVNEGANELKVQVLDSFDTRQPRGKQRWKDESFTCWYVQTTGIWKSVWFEYVPEYYIKSLKITPIFDEKSVEIEIMTNADVMLKGLEAQIRVSFNGDTVREEKTSIAYGGVKVKLDLNRLDLFEWGGVVWTPDTPNLYDVNVSLVSENGHDDVSSYFGLRDIRIQDGQILLNREPLYQRLILDQGYWRESHLTPPSEEALLDDIDKIMALGYNGVRKHQKTEDERFLYWCDVKGLLVWSEFPATYYFDDAAIENFTREWTEIVKQNYSHPCIITWTPFNESWGIADIKNDKKEQLFTEAIYHLTKSIDSMRPVICNDGWEHTISDIVTLHDYQVYGEELYRMYTDRKDDVLSNKEYLTNNHSAFASGYSYKGQPVIISEFGGIAFNEEGGWGYGNKVGSKEEFVNRFDGITNAIKRIPYVCGYCYTQVSDVQQEINGLLTEDRQFKVEPEIIKEINVRRV